MLKRVMSKVPWPLVGFAVFWLTWVALFDPLFRPSWQYDLLIAFAITQVAMLATSIYFHRAVTHQSIEVGPKMDVVFRAVLWITTGQQRRQWKAVHAKHHAFTDVEGDPHSPTLRGIWHVTLLNAYYYAREAADTETLRRFAPEIKDDKWDRRFFSFTTAGPFGAGMGALAILFGWRGIVAGLLHAFLYVEVVAPLINALGHWAGQKNFENTACNDAVLAFLTAGESLHNNHHADPPSPKFSVRWWEFDLSWGMFRVMEFFDLAWQKKPVMKWKPVQV